MFGPIHARGPLVVFGLSVMLASQSGRSQQAAPPAPQVPEVMLTARHRKMCALDVGQPFPNLKLPELAGQETLLAQHLGKRATVVLVWDNENWMTRAALSDLGRAAKGHFQGEAVAIVGLVAGQQPAAIKQTLAKTQAKFPHLVDTAGGTISQITRAVLPQVYVLDVNGAVVWFDIEYSEASRRELRQSIAALSAPK